MLPWLHPPSAHQFEVALETGAAALWERGIQGDGVTVAVLDSGVRQQALGQLADQVLFKIDLTGENHPDDTLGHGTRMCNCILGHAPKSRIASIRVVDRYGLVDRSSVIRGIEWCIDHLSDIRIINISLSIRSRFWWWHFCTHDAPCELCSKTNEAVTEGLIVVAAAGNRGPRPGTVGCPGAAEKAWTIGAYGKRPHWTGRLLERALPSLYYRLGHGAQGTSVATAFSSGTVALILSALPDLQPSEIDNALNITATQFPDAPAEGVGAGGEHCYRAYKLLHHKRSGKPFNPELGYEQFQYGKAFLAQGYFEEAHEQFQYAVQNAPTSSTFHNELGLTYLQRHDNTNAIRALWEAVRLDWNSEFAHNNLGILFENLGETELATFHFETAKKLDPNLQTAVENLERVLRKVPIQQNQRARMDKIVECWLRAVKLLPSDTKGNPA